MGADHHPVGPRGQLGQFDPTLSSPRALSSYAAARSPLYRAFRISVLNPKNADTSGNLKRAQFSTIFRFEKLCTLQNHNKFQLLYTKLIVII